MNACDTDSAEIVETVAAANMAAYFRGEDPLKYIDRIFPFVREERERDKLLTTLKDLIS